MSCNRNCIHTHWVALSTTPDIKCTQSLWTNNPLPKTPNIEIQELSNIIILTNCQQSQQQWYPQEYTSVRKQGIAVIKGITREFVLSNHTFHLAVSLLDKISNKINQFFEIKSIAMFCVILATKFFDENAHVAKLIERKYSSRLSTNYKKDEIYLLNLLDYDLCQVTSYDLLCLLLHSPFIINHFRNVNFNLFEHTSLAYINKFIECKSTLYLTPLQVASGIIQLISMKFNLGLLDITSISNEDFINNSLIGYNSLQAEFDKCKNNYRKKIRMNEESADKNGVNNKLRRYSSNSDKSNVSTDEDAEVKEKVKNQISSTHTEAPRL